MLDEINLAIGVNEQTLSYADLELKGSFRLQETLSSRCDLMIAIIESKIYFIQQTVKKFLLDLNMIKQTPKKMVPGIIPIAALIALSREIVEILL